MNTTNAKRAHTRNTGRAPRPLTARRVRRARKLIAREACAAAWGIRHRWISLDGYFWQQCRNCQRVA